MSANIQTQGSSLGNEENISPFTQVDVAAKKEEADTEKHGRVSKVKETIAHQKEKVSEKAKPPGGYDPTPLPKLPPGYTVKFTFHKALNLPISDVHSSSSDPYIAATLTADIPTRHKEDPLMIHRTKTIHRSTEPVWNEDWVVANIPPSGFRLKCRLYDEDPTDHDDRLGNVTLEFPSIGDDWKNIEQTQFDVKKRVGSKRAYLFRGATSVLQGFSSITPKLELSIIVLGKSDAPGGRMYTIGPTTWTRHFSPMIGRLTGTRVNKDERQDEDDSEPGGGKKTDKTTKKYDFQANELQLQGPVPEQLYHRYVEFRPIIGLMFSSRGLSGRILNKALHKQHNRIYKYNPTTEYGSFEACSEQAALQFLKLAHFAEGGRIFTYIISLDGVMRFTETGKEFGIDMLSKHTMHSDVATYIAFSGEFFIRRLGKHGSEPRASTDGDSNSPIGSEDSSHSPMHYQLVIDNDSGTYRPDKSLLPQLKGFLEHNFPGLNIATFHWEDSTVQKMKESQLKRKNKEGPGILMVLNKSPTNSSFSSSDESRLSEMGRGNTDGHGKKSKREKALELLEDPRRVKDLVGASGHGASAGEIGEVSTHKA